MKILLLSDTHDYHNYITIPLDIDIVIFAGDSSTYRDYELNKICVLNFIDWFSMLPIKHKIWIAGNHETSIDNKIVDVKKLSDNGGVIYLEDSYCVINGYKIYGSPYTPTFGVGWAFNLNRGEPLYQKWQLIPNDTDILITHGPPFGILDGTYNGQKAGCEDLYIRVFQVKPKLHVFGHIHYGYGYREIDGIMFVNASNLGEDYKTINPPIVITLNENKDIIDITQI